ncbi:hypothetical protein JI664_04045 [Rhodobacter sp. NTK016B]|uniref:hypothetical protein n=1 Tax=Rhodobacter sp. NTK016B TaxID=2759676 RepID=UPI001A8CA90A|nr:hypothetical protein [Rhodobacter sp. NTK016B]MBN8291130.1 hypothetical protein [Rhodobacter sp. NTK016B]
MSTALPAAFDPEWYLATYPDVALTGMDPVEHYQRFGRMLGRQPSADAPRSRPVLPHLQPDTATAKPVTPATASAAPELAIPRPSRPGPIIDRPAGFNAAASIPGTLLSNVTERTKPLTLAHLADTPQAESATPAALNTYAKLFGLPAPAKSSARASGNLTGFEPFQTGALRIESLWYETTGTLRLRIAGGEDSAAWVLSAFQAVPDSPDVLHPAGESLVLPAEGPALWDIALVHPMMPVLVQATGPDGMVQATALLAFPSLLPGGLHGAEGKALQRTSNPMDSLWSLTEMLVREKLGKTGANAPSLAGIRVSLRGATGAEPIFAAPTLDWLDTLFGLSVTPIDDAEDALTQGEAALRDLLGERAPARPQGDAGLILTLPGDGLPTLSALVSRRLDNDLPENSAAPYLVAEDANLRPRWMVSPAVGPTSDPSQPSIGTPGLAASATEAAALPVPVAVLFRPRNPPHPTRLLLPVAPDALAQDTKPSKIGPLLVVLTAHDPARMEELLRSVQTMAQADFVVRLAGVDKAALRASLNRILGNGGWRETGLETDLRSLAGEGDTELLLTLDDRVVLYDPQTLVSLKALIDRTPDTASASCLLLAERVVKKAAVLSPAVGGLFPARVSFATSPSLGFHEPDTFQPLPSADYAVVANALPLSLWRRDVLAALPTPDGPVPDHAADIHLGLDALDAGYRHLCSSKIRAGYLGEYVRRDEIDPVGTQYLRPALWEAIFRRVTVLRELF